MNVMAEKIGVHSVLQPMIVPRFMKVTLSFCSYELDSTPPEERRIIISNDVFDYMLNLRALNKSINNKREAYRQVYAGEIL